MSERFEIIAKHYFKDENYEIVRYIDGKSTLAEEMYNATEKRLWRHIQGCAGCAFESRDEWEMPCAKCERLAEDYYRDSVTGEEE